MKIMASCTRVIKLLVLATAATIACLWSLALSGGTTPAVAHTSASVQPVGVGGGGGRGEPVVPAVQSLAERVRVSPRFRGEFLVYVLTNSGNLHLTVNWLLSLHRVGVDVRVPLIVCVDQTAFQRLSGSGLNTVLLSDAILAEIGLSATTPSVAGRLASSWTVYGSTSYKHLVHVKMFIAAYIVRLGVPLIFSDVDLVLLRRDPVNAFEDMVNQLDRIHAARNISMLIQYDREDNLCTGFYIVRPEPRIQAFFASYVDILHAHNRDPESHQEDQHIFNQHCNSTNCRDNLVGELGHAPNEYLPGRLIFHVASSAVATFVQRRWALDGYPDTVQYPLMAHANFLVGTWKEAKLVAYNMWWVDDAKLLREAGLAADLANTYVSNTWGLWSCFPFWDT